MLSEGFPTVQQGNDPVRMFHNSRHKASYSESIEYERITVRQNEQTESKVCSVMVQRRWKSLEAFTK